jgi:hypothetical protein
VATDREQPLGDKPRFRRGAAIVALVLGLIGLVGCAVAVAIAVLPRHFSAGEQQQIIAWEVQKRWRAMPAGRIFPATVGYSLPDGIVPDDPPLTLQAVRIAIAPQSSCTAAVTSSAAASLLHRNGCSAILRATYIDQTSSFVVTVGIAVLPTPGAASAVSSDLADPQLAAAAGPGQSSAAAAGPGQSSAAAGGPGQSSAAASTRGALPPGVSTVRFSGAAGGLYDYSRQISSTMPTGPYLVMYAAGYSDGRPHVQLAHDSYSQAEMASMAQGVASSVAGDLGTPPPPPHCPGGPGC